MNYIYSILLLIVITIVSLFTGYQFPSQEQGYGLLAMALAFFSGIGGIIFIFIAFFRTFGLRDEHKVMINSLEKKRKIVLLYEGTFNTFKNGFKTEISEYYPNFEKDIFGKISPENLTELKKYAADFPNTSYHKLLLSYIDKCEEYLENIQNAKESVLDAETRIKNLEQSDWYLFKLKNNG